MTLVDLFQSFADAWLFPACVYCLYRQVACCFQHVESTHGVGSLNGMGHPVSCVPA